MKSHKFSISDILTRSPPSCAPVHPGTEVTVDKQISVTPNVSSDVNDGGYIAALPTPPTSPDSPTISLSPKTCSTVNTKGHQISPNVLHDRRQEADTSQVKGDHSNVSQESNIGGQNSYSSSQNGVSFQNVSQRSNTLQCDSQEQISSQNVQQYHHVMQSDSQKRVSAQNVRQHHQSSQCDSSSEVAPSRRISSSTLKRAPETRTPQQENKHSCLRENRSVDFKNTPKRPLSNKATGIHKERTRDPIGQILDSLCNSSGKKINIGPSAFSPFIPNPWNAQLSPLARLTQCDKRCLQMSSNMASPYQHATFGYDVISPQHSAMTHFQAIHAQTLAQQQHQQGGQYTASGQIPFDGGLFPFMASSNGQHQMQQLHGSPQQHEQLMAMGACAPEILANPNCMTQMNQIAPLWMNWLKSSSAETVMSYPMKESRAPPPPRYQCDACKKSYSTFGGLSKHKQFHCVSHVKKEFNCKYCDKSYGSLGALKMHIRTHTLPCKCKLCGKAFSRPWLLQGHVRTHTGEKPFSCAHCGRAFADRSNLRAHLQTHSDIKKYGCKNCTKTFSRMSLLLKHEDGSCLGLRR